MNQNVHSFSIGASVRKGVFIGIVLKIGFQDDRELLTVFGRTKIADLLLILFEYHEYLVQMNVALDPDSIEQVIRNEGPVLTQVEIEDLPVEAVVETAMGHVRADHMLALSLKLGEPSRNEILVIHPNQCEWLTGFIANTLNEFEEDGTINLPTGQAN